MEQEPHRDPPVAAALAMPAPLVWYRQTKVQRRVRLLARLIEMGLAEVVHRGWRVAAKRATRVRLAVAHVDARPPLTPAMADDPVGYLTRRSSPRGFFAISERDRLAVVARQRLGDQMEHTIRAADAILTTGIELLGRRFRPADPDFDWLADPDLGRLWPLTILDDADAVRRVRADVKLVWEVNRHQFLVTLARAFVYSSDERYARAAVSMVMRWIAANPPGLGVNWASNLEVAVRALSWMWTLHFLIGIPTLEAEDLRLWLVSLRQHRDHIASHLSIYTDPTNHLIGEAAALAALTIWLPEWDDSERLRTLAIDTLNRELGKQVADDGVDCEQSTSYQRFVLDFVLQVIALADRNYIPLPPRIRSCAALMLNALRALLGPGRRAPRIGDSDDARGLPLFAKDPWDFGDLLATGAAVLGLQGPPPDLAPFCESALWLGGIQTPPADSPASEATPELRSQILPEGGYAVLRSAMHPAADRLVFDCGPLGYPPHASHGHADLLSVLVDVDGEELLIDPGTFAYYDEAGRRNLFRATRAHNTVEVGGRDQADAFDPFKWLNLPRVGREVCHLGSDFDYVEAWHDGYRRLRPAVRHRRGILGLSGGWVLIDWLEGHREHSFTRWFHAITGARATRMDSTSVRLHTRTGRSWLQVSDLINPQEDDPSLIEEVSMPYSERYGQLALAPAVRLVDRAPLPAIRLTLLVPGSSHRDKRGLEVAKMEGSRAAGNLAVELADANGARWQVAVRTPETSTRVGPSGPRARAALASRPRDASEEFTSRGGFALHRSKTSHEPSAGVACP